MPIRKIKRSGKPSVGALQALADRFTNVMQADIKGSIVSFAKDVDYDKVKEAVYTGDWTKVYDAINPVGVSDTMGDAVKNGVKDAVADASKQESQALGANARDMDIDLSIGTDNPKLQHYVRSRTGALIQNVTENIQNNVQNAVHQGLANFQSPSQIAMQIRDNLPLDDRRQRTLDKYKQSLAATKMAKPKQQALVDKFRNALTDERALTIARTESQYAINFGQAAAWNSAYEKGFIGSDSLKVWVTEADPCPICRPLNNKRVKIFEKFVLPIKGGSVDQAPAHINCRCSCYLVTKD